MASMYAKLMSRITESSLMDEDLPVRYCFMMLLAIADPKGYVIGTDVAIARRMNVDIDLWKRCRGELMKPDPDSNSKEHEGRRIIDSDCERGYFVVNYVKYRETRDEEDRRNYMREYMRKYRDGKGVADVNLGKQCKPQLANEEGEGEEEAKGESNAGPVEEFQSHWNLLPDPFPKIRAMSSGRKSALKSRLKEPQWRKDWKDALERMNGIDFLKGVNKRGWVANVDFFLRPETVTRIMEGEFGASQSQASRPIAAYDADPNSI